MEAVLLPLPDYPSHFLFSLTTFEASYLIKEEPALQTLSQPTPSTSYASAKPGLTAVSETLNSSSPSTTAYVLKEMHPSTAGCSWLSEALSAMK